MDRLCALSFMFDHRAAEFTPIARSEASASASSRGASTASSCSPPTPVQLQETTVVYTCDRCHRTGHVAAKCWHEARPKPQLVLEADAELASRSVQKAAKKAAKAALKEQAKAKKTTPAE